MGIPKERIISKKNKLGDFTEEFKTKRELVKKLYQ